MTSRSNPFFGRRRTLARGAGDPVRRGRWPRGRRMRAARAGARPGRSAFPSPGPHQRTRSSGSRQRIAGRPPPPTAPRPSSSRARWRGCQRIPPRAVHDCRDRMPAAAAPPADRRDTLDPGRPLHPAEDEEVAGGTPPQSQPVAEHRQAGRRVLDRLVPRRPVDRVAVEEASARGQDATRDLADHDVPGVAQRHVMQVPAPTRNHPGSGAARGTGSGTAGSRRPTADRRPGGPRRRP